ncbi:MAG: hypothetical protein K2N44_18770 [Lachnospiraceae bacterium]|nr:hypothetical protein [Lachnospiraceae bacterium]
MRKDRGEEKYSDMLYEATKNILSKMELPRTISIKVLPYADEKLMVSSEG